MEKDFLNIEKIKCDFKKQFISLIKDSIVIPIFLLLFIAITAFLLSLCKPSSLFIIIAVIVISPVLLYIYSVVYMIFESYKTYKAIKNESFKIVTDKLVGSQENAIYVGSAFLASFNKPYRLTFASYGEFGIPDENYSSSKLYAMNAKGVFNYSHIGDTFYLVIDKKEKILLAYSANLFELKD